MPMWVGEPPGWFPDEFLWTVGCSYRGLPTKPAEVRNVFGGAMLLKRQIFQRVGTFSTDLGRQGTSFPLSGEETELCIRARAAIPDGRFMLEPSSVVWHKVPAARLTWTYFRSRCYAEGVSKAHLAALCGNRDVLVTERDYTLRALPAGFARGFSDLFRSDADGLKRSAAIVFGLASAAAGYFAGRLNSLRHRAPDVVLHQPVRLSDG